jgi:hypothetical protein
MRRWVWIVVLIILLLGILLFVLFNSGGSMMGAPPPGNPPPAAGRNDESSASPPDSNGLHESDSGGRSPASDSSGSGTNEARVPLTWNYWLTQDGGALVPKLSPAPVDIHKLQRLQFRLSLLDLARFYPELGSLGGSSALQKAVDDAIETDRPTLDLDVLVQTADAQLVQVSPASRRTRLSIDLDALRKTLSAGTLAHAGAEPSETTLAAAKVAEFGIDFTPMAPGTHQIGIVILDAESGFPLQSMVADVTVGAQASSAVKVRTNGSVADAAAVKPADLALYLFDLSSTQDGSETHSLHAQLYYRDKATGRHDFVTWRTTMDLDGMRDATHTFNNTVGTIDSGKDLLQLGYEFGRMVFGPGASGEDCGEGSDCASMRRAREVIHAAAAYPTGALPPTMLVRIVSGTETGKLKYASDVFPFGAMGVGLRGKSDAIYLGERFALALVLTDQQFRNTTSCPANWYLSVPRKEDHQAKNDPLKQALTNLSPLLVRLRDSGVVQPQSASLDELREWLDSNGEPGERSVVLAYVGHHDDGHLYLKENDPGLIAGSIQREFDRASIAILAACNSAMTRVSSGTPIGSLARRHVDSTIATTSKISGFLAGDYLECLDTVLNDPRQLTVGQANALATQCLWSKESSARWRHDNHYFGAALKYLLIGDPNQPLCSPRKGKPL